MTSSKQENLEFSKNSKNFVFSTAYDFILIMIIYDSRVKIVEINDVAMLVPLSIQGTGF